MIQILKISRELTPGTLASSAPVVTLVFKHAVYFLYCTCDETKQPDNSCLPKNLVQLGENK